MRAGEIRRSLAAFLLSLAMALSTFFVIMGAQGTRADGTDPPIHIHLTWGQEDTAHTIVVTWKTLYENAGDNVLYDIQSRGGNPDNYDYSAIGSHHTYSGAGGYIHDVELTGLSPDNIYYFICGGGNGGWSDERSFRTASEASTNIRFVAGGDSRSGGNWPGPRDSVSRAMAKFNPSFVLFTGDFIQSWNDQSEWDNWFAAAQMYWVDNDNLTIPMIPCIGNHEVYYPQPSDYDPETQATNYYGQFYLPENERWYSLDWGPDLHITVLDAEIRSRSDAWNEQLSWLENDLAANRSCIWKIVIFHRPAYSGGSHGSDWLTRSDWVPLFDNYHVDLVISGHDHDYERTHPIYQNTVQTSPLEGTTYIVSGGWGAPLYTGSPQWWTAYGPDSRYHFTVIDIFENNTLHLRAVGTNGQTFDELYIHKENYDVEVSISPHENSGLPGAALTYIVTVKNVGTFDDNYTLAFSDDAGWGPTIDNNLLEVPVSQNRTTTLRVTIPENAIGCTRDNITVTATSQADNTVSDNDLCIAHATIVRDVKITISPVENIGLPGKTLSYTLTVSNTGNVPDNYSLENSDNTSWALMLDNDLLAIPVSENRTTTLRVTIPKDATACMRDNITVTATSMENGDVSDNATCIAHCVLFIPRSPIYIEGNDNFTPANGVNGGGSGIKSDPYLIENWDISAENANGIEIRNTTAYFIIRNCYVHRWDNWNRGIYFDNVTNGKINNVASENKMFGIYLWFSDNNIIENCITENNGYGIRLDYSHGNLVFNNVAENNGNGTGVALDHSDSNLMSNNVMGNNYWGITLVDSDNNLVSNNVAKNNRYGIALQNSDNNLIYHNNFVNNSTTNAYDDGSNYWDNGYPSGGNYWSDYAGTDYYKGENQDIPGSDGIGDTPYYILGDNNKDRYPLMKLDLVAGWNLISFPVASENDTPENIFAGQTYYIWKWDAAGKTYVSPPSDQPVELGVGYWVWVDHDKTVTTSGIPVENYSIDLITGWNLIGFPVTNENTTPANLFAGQTYYIWKWDAAGKTYVSPPSDQPVELGVGYWIWVSNDKTVTVPL